MIAVKALVSIVAMLTAVATHASDWQATLSPPQPGNFPAPKPARLSYRFGWSALHAADGTFDESARKAGQMRLDVSVKTVGAVRKLFRLDAQFMSVSEMSTLRPVSMRQVEVHSDESIATKLEFDAAGVTRTRHSTQNSPGNGNPKRLEFSPLYDLFSAFLWIRSQPLENGSRYSLVIYPATDAYLAEVQVLGRETLRTGGQSRNAIKLGLKLQRLNKQLEPENYKKFRRASAWISDDSERLLLKAQADIFVGAVWTELQKVEPLPQ